MPHILDAGDLNGNEVRELDASPQKGGRGKRFAWENITRCLVIAGVVALVAMMAWRPATLRFSQLMFLVSPSHGDSLAWKPDPEPALRPATRRHTLAPAEWRLTATNYGGWKPARNESGQFDNHINDWSLNREWQRLSFNPWTWQNDVPFFKKRLGDSPPSPEPQPVTAFRVKDGEVWSHPGASPAAPAETASAETASVTAGGSSPAITMPSLSPVPLEIPSLQPVAEAQKSDKEEEEKPPLEEIRPGLLELPPLSFDDVDFSGAPGEAAEETVAEIPETVTLTNKRPEPETEEETPAPAAPVTEAGDAPEQVRETEPEKTVADSEVNGDWVNTEIAEPIPGAYLTIYPKLKFIGLCVPGQGYVRKYNQVATPGNLTDPKFGAHDGKTPYGKYYVAARDRGARGPTLTLSWPSPEDARRIGLPAGQMLDIENAWLAQRLPLQTTVAGGGLMLTGDRGETEETDGGFSLEEPHMEEIFTALPDGAWVFIQQ